MLKDDRVLVLAATAAGVVLAAVVTLLQASVYRADASIALVRQGQPPGSDPALAQAAEAAADLFHSRAVAEPAIANLRLKESADELLERVSVETEAESSLVRVEVEAPSKNEARRTAQELVEVGTVLYNDRFGPAVSASIWETPRAQADRVAPKPARNLALGALLGALVGWGISASRRRPVRRRLKAAPAPASDPAPVALPLPGPQPEPGPQPAGPFVLPHLGEWTVHDVERLLAEEGPAFPDRAEELGVYLDSFRDVAGPDGKLPSGVEAVMEDVFRDLIVRAGVELRRGS